MLDFFLRQRKKGKNVFGYGAAAKGNTFLNFAGIKRDLISAIVDNAKSKIGLETPGSHIPVIAHEECKWEDVDTLILLPWNIKDELILELRPLSQTHNFDIYVMFPKLTKI